jgi:hypothetical protein
MIKRSFLFFFFALSLPSLVCSGELTSVERRRIESEATDAFNVILHLWKEGKYEDLYGHGHRKSQSSHSKEDFMSKMRKKVNEMALSWEKVRDVEAEVVSRKLAYVKAKIGYRKKKGGETRFVTESYRMTHEDSQWRIDLSQLIRSPF